MIGMVRRAFPPSFQVFILWCHLGPLLNQEAHLTVTHALVLSALFRTIKHRIGRDLRCYPSPAHHRSIASALNSLTFSIFVARLSHTWLFFNTIVYVKSNKNGEQMMVSRRKSLHSREGIDWWQLITTLPTFPQSQKNI